MCVYIYIYIYTYIIDTYRVGRTVQHTIWGLRLRLCNEVI